MRVIEERVLEIVAEHLQHESGEISLDTNLVDLGADDLDRVELAMALEETFATKGEEIPDDEVGRWVTVRDLVASVDKALTAGGSK